MIIQTEHLGKVSVTVEKDYHNINRCYDKLTIVEEKNEFRTYISRKPVPSGIELTDRNYWIPFSSLERQIVIDYNKFKNDVLFASAFHEKLDPTLPEGVAIIKQLFDKDNNPIIPKVSEEAVSDETGKTLKAKLAELTTTLSNTIDTYLDTYFADTIEKAEDIINHPTYIGEDNYVYVWNRITKTYDKTSIYTRGEGFHVSKTFGSVADMEAYTGTDLKEGDFVLIQSTPDDPDNAKLYTYSGTQGVYKFLVDMSGALGFTGKTPQFSIGTVITIQPAEQASASLSPDGTDADGNPKYKLNLALPKGLKGDKGEKGDKGDKGEKGEKGTSDFVVVEDHSGAGDDPDKIYIPSAESHKQLYEGLIEDEEVLIKELRKREDSFQRHITNEEIHVNAGILQDIENSVANNRVLSKLVFAGHDCVDLGLSSGNLWATTNVGATRVEEEGHHFMWGDSTLKTNPSEFTPSNCMYFDGTNYANKYKAILKVNGIDYFIQQCNIEDDIANKLWKGCWQIPTLDDFIELLNHFNRVTTINGIECFLYYSHNEGNNLFIPVSSIFDNGNIINGDRTDSRYLVRDIEGVDRFSVVSLSSANAIRVNDSIYKGFCVRPVLKLK